MSVPPASTNTTMPLVSTASAAAVQQASIQPRSSPEPCACALRQRERQHCGAHPEGEAGIEEIQMGDDAEVWTQREERHRREGGAPVIESRQPAIDERQAGEAEADSPQARAPVAQPHDRIERCRRPVLQHRLLEVLQPIEPRGDPVAARHHLAGNLRVAPLVGIEHRADLNGDEPHRRQRDPTPPPHQLPARAAARALKFSCLT